MSMCNFKKLQSNFIETTLRHGCSPVNLLNIFRKPFYKNTSGGLLLFILDLNDALECIFLVLNVNLLLILLFINVIIISESLVTTLEKKLFVNLNTDTCHLIIFGNKEVQRILLETVD